MKPINVGLLGIGTVGGGTWEVLNRNADEIQRRAGRAIRITRVADKAVAKRQEDRRRQGEGHRRRLRGRTRQRHRHRGRADRRLHHRQGAGARGDPQRQARGHRQQGAARHARQRDLRRGAEEGRDGGFEASVAGGIPIIKALREGLAANRIEWIAGIINGTSNFILSEMRDKGLPFDDGAGGRAEARLRRGRPDLRHRGHRRRAQAHHPVGARLRHPDAVQEGVHRGHLEAHARGHRLRRGARLPHQAARHHEARRRRASSCACIRRWSRRGA